MTWTLETLHRPAFELLDAAQFVHATGMGDKLPDGAVKNWTVRGFLAPTMGKRGKKDVRRYTAADLIRIYIVSRLQHTSLKAAFLAAECGVERIEGFIKGGKFPFEVSDEYWVTFLDEGDDSHRYTGNDVTNFWVEKSFTNEGHVCGPLIANFGDHGMDVIMKQETFNLDAALKRFFLVFYDIDRECHLEDKMDRITGLPIKQEDTEFLTFLGTVRQKLAAETTFPNPNSEIVGTADGDPS